MSGPGQRSEIAGVLASDTIRYSQVWEDHVMLERGLDIRPDDDVLSITSAGDNALALLLAGARSVTAIDLNPAQTHLFRLKLAGIRALALAELRCLIGVDAGPRVELAERLEPALADDTVAFWRANRALIAAGLLGCGRLECYFGDFQRQVPELVDRPLDTLLALDDPARQREQFATVCGARFEQAFRHHFGRDMMARQGRDPAQFKYVDEGDVGGFFFRRFRHACTELPLRDNFYITSFLTGAYRDTERVPPYLRPDNFARLKTLVDRVHVVTDELERFVRTGPKAAFSKLNLSDVFEYMSVEATQHLLGALAEWMRPKGRIAYWNLLVPRCSSESQRGLLTPLTALSRQLWDSDRAWFYRAFHLEEVAS